jgi:phosphoribosylaminoimidazole (AIR) synthetase
MARVFNLGIGMIVVVPREDVFRALDVLRARGLRGAAVIGDVVEGRQVLLQP